MLHRTQFETDEGFRIALRDWFAGQALAGMIRGLSEKNSFWTDETADIAYKFADAMLAEREKGGD